MSDSMPMKTKKEKLREAFKIFAHVFLVDVLPQVAKIALPILVSYITKKEIDSATNNTAEGNSI